MRRIGLLNAIEQQGRELAPRERLQLRQDQAKPRLSDWSAWLLAAHNTVAVASGTAKAIDYALECLPALLRYPDSGALPMDNNAVDNTIRLRCTVNSGHVRFKQPAPLS